MATIELFSPANKDRLESRLAFVSKGAALLPKKICVSIVDLVTVKNFNLFCEVLDIFAQTDPAFSPQPPPTSAVTLSQSSRGKSVTVRVLGLSHARGRAVPSVTHLIGQ